MHAVQLADLVDAPAVDQLVAQQRARSGVEPRQRRPQRGVDRLAVLRAQDAELGIIERQHAVEDFTVVDGDLAAAAVDRADQRAGRADPDVAAQIAAAGVVAQRRGALAVVDQQDPAQLGVDLGRLVGRRPQLGGGVAQLAADQLVELGDRRGVAVAARDRQVDIGAVAGRERGHADLAGGVGRDPPRQLAREALGSELDRGPRGARGIPLRDQRRRRAGRVVRERPARRVGQLDEEAVVQRCAEVHHACSIRLPIRAAGLIPSRPARRAAKGRRGNPVASTRPPSPDPVSSMPPFLVPDDFRAFMRSVVDDLDAPGDARLVDAEDAFQDECGFGGRTDGGFRFHYLTRDGVHRWIIPLAEHEIRAIADGLQIEAEAERSEVSRTHQREPKGDPLLIWGAYNDDALAVRSLDHLIAALETLRVHALDEPRILRVWSPSDDQLVAAMWRDHCALYVIESVVGYATSTGDPLRTDAFEVLDHDGNPLIVPWADCVAWPAACRALVRFAAHGDLGPEIIVEGRIPSQLLMHGELDRQAVLAMRAVPAREPAGSSLPRLTPLPQPVAVPEPAGGDERAAIPEPVPELADVTAPIERVRLGVAELTAWGRRLIQLLFARELIELDAGPGIDEISYQLSGLLQAHGEEAEHSLETAEWLANEIGSIRGIRALFATGGDLQLALRRTRIAA